MTVRRLLPILLLLLASPAWAGRAAVIQARVMGEVKITGNPDGVDRSAAIRVTTQAVTSFLDRFNPGGYDFYVGQKSAIRSQGLAAQGIIGDLPHDLVVQIGFPRLASDQLTTAGIPDSLIWNAAPITGITMAGYVTAVPQLIFDCPKGETNMTTVMDVNTECYDPANQGPGYAGARLQMKGTNYVWPVSMGGQPAVSVTKGAATGTPAGDGAGGISDSSIRIVIGSHATNWNNSPFSAGRVPPAFRDSLYSDSAATQAFSTYWNKYVTAFPNQFYGEALWVDYGFTDGTASRKPVVYDHWMGNSATMNGGQTSSSDGYRNTGDFEIIYAGLALADSMCNRCLLGQSVEPIRVAIQVSNGVDIGGAFLGGGISPADSATQLSNMADSLASLGVPIDVLTNPDSLAFHAGLITRWKRIKTAHFGAAPKMDSTTFVGGKTTPGRPVDPLGDLRWRAYYGPNNGNATDTSRFALVWRTYAMLDSVFGRQNVDHIWGGQADDWSPVGMGMQSAIGADSLVWVCSKAGIRGFSCDAEADSEATGTSARGLPGGQRMLTNSIDPSLRLAAICFPGYNPRGATRGNGRDSSLTYAANEKGANDSCFIAHYMQRSLTGAVLPYWYVPQNRSKNQGIGWTQGGGVGPGGYTNYLGEYLISGQISTKANTNTGVNIIRISASSLGSGEWGASSPNNPGWYQIKYTVNALRAINRLAGRELFRFVYPDDIAERDLRR